MSNHSWTWQDERAIPSETGAGRVVVEDVLRQLDDHGWVKADIFSIHLAIEEALVNAIKHGNGLDASKQVQVVCQISQQRFRIEITDEGPGFDPATLPDCTAEENLEAPCGRGVMLMKEFMTRVEYNEAGNRVLLEKDRTEAADGGQ